MDGLLRRGARPQLFPYPLVDQHVRVNGHAERQRDSGDAWQGERGLQHGQQRQQQQHVQGQADRGEHAEQVVVQDDEDGDGQETVQRRMEALRDVVGAQARADGAFFDDGHRSCCPRSAPGRPRFRCG
ncbi:hypothetical protein G6F62_014976 [Rhizopus arrhizus]|nr:hypothetical protein G6F62_014976 [Rhizopus arrhizus]